MRTYEPYILCDDCDAMFTGTVDEYPSVKFECENEAKELGWLCGGKDYCPSCKSQKESA